MSNDQDNNSNEKLQEQLNDAQDTISKLLTKQNKTEEEH